MPSKNKCNNPNRNNHSIQQKNNRTMKRSSLNPREVERVLYLEDKVPNMVPVKSARIKETKNPKLPCINQSVMRACKNIFLHAHTTNSSNISLVVKE